MLGPGRDMENLDLQEDRGKMILKDRISALKHVRFGFKASAQLANPSTSSSHTSPSVDITKKATTPPSPPCETEEAPQSTSIETLRQAVASHAGEFKNGPAATRNLLQRFHYAQLVSCLAGVLAFLLSYVVWSFTKWWLSPSNALVTGTIVLISSLWICQTYVFRWLWEESESDFQNRAWDLCSDLLKPSSGTAQSEAAHWLNDIFDSIWSFINPDIFRPLTDVLEQLILDNAPPILKAVGTRKIGQGDVPFRVIGVRRLPEELISRGDTTAASGVFDEIMSLAGRHGTADELKHKLRALKLRTSVHLEFAFEYGLTAQQRKDKRKGNHIHLLLVFHTVGGFRLPVWVAMEKIVGTLRANVQLKPDAPFVTIARCSLMSRPEIQMTCRPLFRQSLNIMGMPLISGLIRQSLDQALTAYIHPKSVDINVERLLVGDTDAHDTYPLGVILVKIHRVNELVQSLAGNDFTSYFSVGWAKMGDPLYIFRTIRNCSAPRWEEEMAYEVGPDEVNSRESLKLDLCRRAQHDGEDCVATTQLLLADIITMSECARKMHKRNDILLNPIDGREIAKLDWSIGFYPRASIAQDQLSRQKLFPAVSNMEEFEQRIETQTRHKFREAPQSSTEEFQRERNAAMREAELKILNGQVPLDRYPSGILQVELPIINFLSMDHAERESDESEHVIYDDDTDDFVDRPDSYANIYINEERMTRTLTKPKDSDPAYGSTVYRFVRDWRTAEVTIVVRNKRVSKADDLIGAIRINVSELFKRHQSSRIRQGFAVEGGKGGGLADIVVLFRAVDRDPPMPLQTWNYGSVELLDPITSGADMLDHLNHCTLAVRTASTKHSLRPSQSKHSHELAWQSENHGHGRELENAVFPLRNKHSERLIFTWATPVMSKLHRKSHGNGTIDYAFMTFEALSEGIALDVELPVYQCKTAEFDENNLWPDAHQDCLQTGSIKFTVVFRRGLTKAHAECMKHKDVDEIIEVNEALALER